MKKHLLMLVCTLAIASTAVAQTKISGILECEKANVRNVIQIPEREGFNYAISQYKCTWTKGVSIEGLQSKDHINTVFGEVMGSTISVTSAGVSHYPNGDRAYTRSVGTRDPKKLTSTSRWTFELGTGKLSGIKGGGTSTCKIKSAEPDAGYTCEVQGEYILPAAKK